MRDAFRMNPVLDEILRSNKVTTSKGLELPLSDNIPRGEGEFLQGIVRMEKPRTSLEVGCANGISTMFICETLRETRADKHIVIDPYQNTLWKGVGLKNLHQAGYDKLIEFIEEPSEIALPELAKRKTRIDFAFVDGWHTFDHTLVDFFYINKILNVGGVVAFDDADWPSIYNLGRFISRCPSYKIRACWPQRNVPARFKAEKILNIYINSLLTHNYSVSTSGSFKAEKIFDIIRRRKKHLKNDLHLLSHRCVVFQKEEEDKRNFNWHEEF